MGRAPASGSLALTGSSTVSSAAYTSAALGGGGRADDTSANAELSSCRAVRSSCADVPYDTCEPDGARDDVAWRLPHARSCLSSDVARRSSGRSSSRAGSGTLA